MKEVCKWKIHRWKKMKDIHRVIGRTRWGKYVGHFLLFTKYFQHVNVSIDSMNKIEEICHTLFHTFEKF